MPCKEGKTDLMNFVLKLSDKRRCKIIKTAWRMKNANADLERSKKTIMQLLEKAKKGVCSCNGQWVERAVETLTNNNIDSKRSFASWPKERK